MLKPVVGVDKFCPYCPYDGSSVLSTKYGDSDDFEWNVTLWRPHANSFYVLQIVTATLELNDEDENIYVVYCRAGTANGNSITKVKQCQIYQKFFNSEDDAIFEFKKIFKNKTKNDFDDDFDTTKHGYKVLK